MPLSMVTKETKQLVKKSGYNVLAWALKIFLAQGQHSLVARIIVALCLERRASTLEDNGIRAILGNHKLRQNAANDTELKHQIRWLADQSPHYDKVGATLVANWWWNFSDFHPRHSDPLLSTDDSCMFFTSAIDHFSGTRHYQVSLCDHGGCQREREFGHFRLILDFNGSYGVRVIGRQIGPSANTTEKCESLRNGYFEYRIPSYTVLYRIGDDLDGRTLDDILQPGIWYNYNFQPDTELDLVDHERMQVMQTLANTIMKVGQLNG